ncbi:hypothetical protein [Streptacidiphilus neutrinimicus]|uniref:hypothetical protein n=1 Tax=Streptacidiphilus neutrinimicus TaxID=105420 RepID=UPI0005A8545F|nr:hypothetical protein [Streptacidiphilus neutrinimicus]
MNQISTAAIVETELSAEAVDATEQDPAGGITLSGRNRVCARARVLAGLVLTSGLVVALSTVDTSVSAPHIS